MADYNKQTVTQLRQLLKDRGIASTGLTRKAQIVEKLEEADEAVAVGGDAPAVTTEADESATEPNDDAPPERVQQAQKQEEGEGAASKENAPGPALSDAGEPAALSLPVATVDANRETISHLDSDVPPPDPTKVIEQTAEDTTTDNEPGTVQPAGVFNAAPADPEDVVVPKITEPTDAEIGETKQDNLAKDELPDAPGPAAEALRLARQDLELPEGNSDSVMEDQTPTPGPNEQSSVEKAELLAIPEQSTAETSRLNTEEREADSKKRKRRSNSPDLPTQDINAKKPRPNEDVAPDVHLKEDDDVVMEQRGPEQDGIPAAEDSGSANRMPTVEDAAKPRWKENGDQHRPLGKSRVGSPEPDVLQDASRPVDPALHPATPALYIRNLMRPLRLKELRTYLVSLATPPSGSPNTSVVKTLFLDQTRTHALVLFSNTNAASRVRTSLHGSIWPVEVNRKVLWVDFVPEESVEDWISIEEAALAAEQEARAARRCIPPKVFEVVYPGNDVAVFQEVGSSAPVNAPRGPRGSTDARRPSQPVDSAPTEDTRQDIAASFRILDEQFLSTTAKPHLYYLPVKDDISEARLDDLYDETSRDWAPGGTRKGRGIRAAPKFKFSFDHKNRVVQAGNDHGPWAEDYSGGRGRGGGHRGRGGRRGGDGGGFGRGGGHWRG